jgi:hemerythrin superfamily protein
LLKSPAEAGVAKRQTKRKPASTRRTSKAASKPLDSAQRKSRRTTRITAAAEAVGRAVGRTMRAVANRRPFASNATNAIGLLKRDHRRLEALLSQGERATDASRRSKLLDTIAVELGVHELIEEKILYPALKPHAEATDIVLEGYQEHHVADLLVKELTELSRSDERWGAKFKVFKENIEHHIEEEEGDMFKKARSMLGRAELERLGARMQRMKAEHM